MQPCRHPRFVASQARPSTDAGRSRELLSILPQPEIGIHRLRPSDRTSSVRRVDGSDHAEGARVDAANRRLGARVAAEPIGPSDGLTEREAEVLRMIALGYTNSQIAHELFLSVRTVETHRAHVQQKLRLVGRAALVRYALDHGLMTPTA